MMSVAHKMLTSKLLLCCLASVARECDGQEAAALDWHAYSWDQSTSTNEPILLARLDCLQYIMSDVSGADAQNGFAHPAGVAYASVSTTPTKQIWHGGHWFGGLGIQLPCSTCSQMSQLGGTLSQ